MLAKHRSYRQYCAKLRQQSLLRRILADKQFQLDFSTNDYLGLSQHPKLIQAAIEAADRYGVGNKASRLISDHKPLQDLEAKIAQAKNTQSALVFATGFQANVSVLSALLNKQVLGAIPLVFSDKLNHASMHVACQMAKIKQHRYQHGDYDHLKYFLELTKSSEQPKFILTESVFGMDGDVADLAKLVQLAKDYHALLYVDEAHATGLFGSKGYGLTAQWGKEIDVSMGTFSKALGGSGAYIACHHTLKRYFVNKCQGLIYSTGPSPMQVAAMNAAWEIIPTLRNEVTTLFKNAQFCRKNLIENGFNIGTSSTHLIPIILHSPQITLDIQSKLAQNGIKVGAIRPPSVGPKQSRLRIALNVNHTQEEIKKLINTLNHIFIP